MVNRSLHQKSKVAAAMCRLYKGYSVGKLSYAKLIQMLYLADWKHVLLTNKQITDISWCRKFDSFSNFSGIITSEKIARGYVFSGSPTFIVSEEYICSTENELSETEKKALDHVIDVTNTKDDIEFIQLVESTFPMFTGDTMDFDLVNDAAKYQEWKNENTKSVPIDDQPYQIYEGEAFAKRVDEICAIFNEAEENRVKRINGQNEQNGLSVKPFFRWYDLWIGAFIDTKGRAVYICPLPMLGIKINY